MAPLRLHKHIRHFACRTTSRRWRVPRSVLPCQHPMRERRERQVADPVPGASRKDRCFRLSPKHRILWLTGTEGNQPTRARKRRSRINLLCSPLAETNRSHLPSLNCPIEGSQCLFEWRLFVIPVALVEINELDP